jgi:GNAT superfamily N-acetyltransferase
MRQHLVLGGPGGVELDSDPARLDVDTVCRWISEEAYWAVGRDRAVIERSLAGSLVFGVYAGADQVAFARVVTDGATFAWLCDVFVDKAARGRGLGTWLVGAIVEHIEGAIGINRVILATKDAHGVYAKLGFTPFAHPERFMERDNRPSF